MVHLEGEMRSDESNANVTQRDVGHHDHNHIIIFISFIIVYTHVHIVHYDQPNE